MRDPVTQVYNSDLAIGDLTFHNPNAHYEIALRHASGKSIVHFRRPEWRIPFNLGDYRAITANISTARGLKQARQELAEYVADIERPDYKVTNPVTRALGINKLQSSADDKDSLLASIRADLDDTKIVVESLLDLSTSDVSAQKPIHMRAHVAKPNADWSSLSLGSRLSNTDFAQIAEDIVNRNNQRVSSALDRRLSELEQHFNDLSDKGD